MRNTFCLYFNSDLLDEARNYFLMPERRLSLQTFKTTPRCCDDVVGYIYVVGGLTKSGSVNCFHLNGATCVRCKLVIPDHVSVSFSVILFFSLYYRYPCQAFFIWFKVLSNCDWSVAGFKCSFMDYTEIYVICVLFRLTSFAGDSVSTLEIFDPITKLWSVAESVKMYRSRVGGKSTVQIVTIRFRPLPGFRIT